MSAKYLSTLLKYAEPVKRMTETRIAESPSDPQLMGNPPRIMALWASMIPVIGLRDSKSLKLGAMELG